MHVHEELGIRFMPKWALFAIYQQNDFKNLLHLKLDLVEGSDYEVKNHMAQIIKDGKI